MRTRESIYVPLGYKVEYLPVREKFKGFHGPPFEPCLITDKDGHQFLCFDDARGKQRRIMEFQDSIPHMAKFSMLVKDHILIENASGELIWHLEEVAGIERVERQLNEFADATKLIGISHRDIRPWNVFLDESGKVTVIDWGHSENETTDLDHRDVQKLGQLVRGEITFQNAWGGPPGWLPNWCKKN